MPYLKEELDIPRCPRCGIASPNMVTMRALETNPQKGGPKRFWRAYRCVSCAGVVLAESTESDGVITRMDPEPEVVDESIPEQAQEFLRQALDSLNAPAGAVMLANSAVDAMLKDKGYKKGFLKPRIDQAAEDHLITPQMAEWAHEVRLDANEPRHADEAVEMPGPEEARKTVMFAKELGQFLYVVPSRITRFQTAVS